MNIHNLQQIQLKGEDDENDDDEEKTSSEKPMGGLMGKKQEELFFKNRSIYFWGAVDDKTAREAVTKLLLLDADQPGKEIKFYINSPGGMVTSGMVVYDTIKLIQSPVATICMGFAASMGSIMLAAGEKGRRFIYPHGEVMIHQPSFGGYFQGVSADLEIQAIQIQKTKEISAKILSEASGQPYEKVLLDVERDYYMDAAEAIKYGLVDSVVDRL
ncbi:MAG: ATP-dependent Clp protease proteolytic subunit [Edaphocola sp.]